MRRRLWLLLTAALAGACAQEDERGRPLEETKVDARPIVDLPEPVRGTAGDEDLRVMLSQIAAAQACKMMRGQFRPLRAPDRRDTVTGVLWMKGCEIEQRGTEVTFHLTGQGWQWADQVTKKAGATFHVKQYVRFAVTSTIPGALDIGYSQKSNVLSLYFTPKETAEVGARALGDIEVDPVGAWSTLLGAVSSAFAASPGQQADKQTKAQTEGEFKSEFARGLSATIDLCTGLPRFNMGQPPKGEMLPPDVGESKAVPVTIEPGGVLVFGPYQAGKGMTIDAEVPVGAVRFSAHCHADGEDIAEAFIADRGVSPPKKPIAAAVLRGRGKLKVPPTACPIVVVTEHSAGESARFEWARPATEFARAAGGPLIDCKKR